MYINLDLYFKTKLTPEDIFALVAIKQRYLAGFNEGHVQVFENMGLVEFIKGTSKQPKLEKVRLSKKGSDLLIKLSYEGSEDDESSTIKDWIISVYKNKSGGIVRNKAELGRRIQWFKKISGISGNYLAILIQTAMVNTYSEDSGMSVREFMDGNPRGILSNLAENLFWAPDSIYDKHYTLDRSPLYSFYEQNEEYIKSIWESKLKGDGSRK